MFSFSLFSFQRESFLPGWWIELLRINYRSLFSVYVEKDYSLEIDLLWFHVVRRTWGN